VLNKVHKKMPKNLQDFVNLNSEGRLFQRLIIGMPFLSLAFSTQRLVTSALLAGCQGPSLRGWTPATTAIQARRYFYPLPCLSPFLFSVPVTVLLPMYVNYLCTYDLYGPVRKVFDAGR
jgi:hypothetical protein